ncbi:MAG: glutaredoxin [Oscillospiraceae bacterium]|nr:glutaredoxin [Oscillospiraceae bacterium]
MKEITLFYLESCPYCVKGFRALEELYAKKPAYRAVPITKIEESHEPGLADRYDYYAVPSLFVGGEKRFEARLFMSYEEIRDGFEKALESALAE